MRHLIAAGCALALAVSGPAAKADWRARVKHLAKEGSVYAVNHNGRALFQYHADRPLIPASILKLITASAAFHYLGLEYRFPTDFFLDPSGNLFIKGYGDPMLISEEWEAIARSLAEKGLRRVQDICVDDSFFAPHLQVPGSTDALDPYNAPVGALSANFNTIHVHVHPDGTVASREPRTPVTEFLTSAARQLNLKGTAYVNLGQNGIDYPLYPGHLLKAFLEREGVPVAGVVRHGKVPAGLSSFHRHLCRDSLEGVVKKMLEYSSNFISNQIFLTLGAYLYGQPATWEKGQRAVVTFLSDSLGVKNAVLFEGSGLCRANQITARQMDRVLEYFRPHRELLPSHMGMLVKTGTLSDVKASAGYFTSSRNGPVRFVLIMNDCRDYQPRKLIMEILKNQL